MNPYIQYMYSYPHKTAYRPLADTKLSDYAGCLKGPGHGLYLHIPFCQAKCGYCNLFSVTGQGEDAMERYLDAVERQCGQYRQVLLPENTSFSELVIGGGTPLLLSERQLRRMFELVRRMSGCSEGGEVVIETAPNQTTAEKLSVLKEAGVTRVSMGIQSFSEQELHTLGRQHDAARAKEALALLKEAGFPCVNVDFIYGVPGQTVGSLLDSLREALRYEPDEIFLYPLYVKHGAYLTHTGVTPDAALALTQYREASAFLRQQGFRQDSMRRFVRRAAAWPAESGRDDRDVVQRSVRRAAAWPAGSGRDDRDVVQRSVRGTAEDRAFSECGFGNSLALGCGGRSYLGRLHFCSPYAVTQKDCLARLKEYEETADYTKITHGILLSEEEQKRRYVIRHLLIRPGIDTGRYEELYGRAVWEDFPVLREWEEQGYLSRRQTGAGERRPDAEERTARRDLSQRQAGAWERCPDAEERTEQGYLSRRQTGAGKRCPGVKTGTEAETGTRTWLGLTERGLELSDYLGPQLISDDVRRAMEEWEKEAGCETSHDYLQR